MLAQSLLDTDQQAAITRLVEHDNTLLIGGMGAGKTVIALTAMKELLDLGAVKRFLVVAPKRPIEQAWTDDLTKWEHLQKLRWRIDYATGTPDERRLVMSCKAQIVFINFENLAWLANNYEIPKYFDGLLIDEISKLKNTGGTTFKRIRRHLRKIPWRTGMTGTPVSEDLVGLFGQMLIVDAGVALGRNKQKYLTEYFEPTDYEQRNWAARPGMEAVIAAMVRPVTHVIPDYTHTLPKLTVRPRYVTLPGPVMDCYRQMARDYVLDGLPEGQETVALNEAVMTTKLRQIACGAVYTQSEDDERGLHHLHQVKERELERVLIECAQARQSLLVVYEYKYQLDMLRDLGFRIVTEDSTAIRDWQAGDVERMAIHYKSAGHGLNLQAGGHRMLWLAPQWSRDMHDQTIARLWRRGQSEPVLVEILAAAGTIEELEVITRLEGKAGHHDRFIQHLADC